MFHVITKSFTIELSHESASTISDSEEVVESREHSSKTPTSIGFGRGRSSHRPLGSHHGLPEVHGRAFKLGDIIDRRAVFVSELRLHIIIVRLATECGEDCCVYSVQ